MLRRLPHTKFSREVLARAREKTKEKACVKEISERRANTMAGLEWAPPIPLKDGNLCKPFVYDRDYGFMYVGGGHHTMVMAILYAWHKGLYHVFDFREKPYIQPSYSADEWLKLPGTAFRSSVGHRIEVGRASNLTLGERRVFEEIGICEVFPGG